MNVFSIAISSKRQVYIDHNGSFQLMTWRADKRASCVTFYVPVDFYESDEFSEQIS